MKQLHLQKKPKKIIVIQHILKQFRQLEKELKVLWNLWVHLQVLLQKQYYKLQLQKILKIRYTAGEDAKMLQQARKTKSDNEFEAFVKTGFLDQLTATKRYFLYCCSYQMSSEFRINMYSKYKFN